MFAVVMHFLEGFPMDEAVYFTLITLTSIGYGDMMPATDAGKIAVVFFVFYSMAAISNAVGGYLPSTSLVSLR